MSKQATHTPGWHWKQNRTMQSLYDGDKQLGVYVPMPNNKSYPLAIRESIAKTAPLIAAAPELLEALKQIKQFAIQTELDGADGARWTWKDIAAKQSQIAEAALARVEGKEQAR